jgi:beta-xylosidase
MKKILSASIMALCSAAFCLAQNPIITTSYTPDPAPYVHGDKLYMFVGHDEDDATYFKMNDWQLFSTEDMVNWTYLGTPISTETFAWAFHGDRAWASQAIERNGKWYWYVCLNDANKKDVLAVAVADDPQGPYVDAIGGPLAQGFSFIDPTVFIDDDGRAYLFWGNKGLWYGELNDDMISIDESTITVMTPEGGSLRDYAYREAPYVFYRNGLYYFLWSVDDTGSRNYHVAYGTSKSPLGPIEVAKQPVILRQDAKREIYGPAHNSVLQIPGTDEWYIVYHRINKDHVERRQDPGVHREVCIDRMYFNEDGTIKPVKPTLRGVKLGEK